MVAFLENSFSDFLIEGSENSSLIYYWACRRLSSKTSNSWRHSQCFS